MTKYCRYCAFCIPNDSYYCTAKDKVLSNINRPVNCDEYAESELGDVDTGRKYKPREPKPKTAELDQTWLF